MEYFVGACLALVFRHTIFWLLGRGEGITQMTPDYRRRLQAAIEELQTAQMKRVLACDQLVLGALLRLNRARLDVETILGEAHDA